MCIGKADIMLDIDLKPYDILPLLPIVNGAGLLVIDISMKKNYSSVVVCKPELEGEMKKLFC
jgi:fructose-1,6-bisphosphatase/inositol monophosphatase family enzyme